MIFNSFPFLFFFITVVIVFFILPQKFKNPFLLIASYYFYFCGKAEYLLLLIGLTIYDYFAARNIARITNTKIKKLIFVTTVILNIIPLFFFKYFDFFSSSLQAIFNYFNLLHQFPLFHTILPIGISFYTFIATGYVIDVYLNDRQPEKNFINFSLYVAFFPQILSGPIARSLSLIPQFYKHHNFIYKNVSDGFKLILWGFFQKFVIADNVASYVDAVYNNSYNHSGSSVLFASYLFAFQLYCDFGGYSNIAIGFARVLGFDLIQNFNLPYFAHSTREFWRRWHISLSNWLRDYIYIPLGGNRKGTSNTYTNIIITMTICGLWHGASWTFIVWGLLHGICLCFGRYTLPLRNKFYSSVGLPDSLKNIIRILITFQIVTFLWIFFRANTLYDALCIIQKIFGFNWGALFIGDDPSLFYGIFGIIILLFIEFQQKDLNLLEYINSHNTVWRWSFCVFCILSIVLFGELDGTSFIYFQF